MDGNGRWLKNACCHACRATARGPNRSARSRSWEWNWARISTFYAFSTENWNRPADEVKGLLKMLKERLIKEIPELNEQNIHVQFIGSNAGLDPDYLKEIKSTAAMTDGNTA